MRKFADENRAIQEALAAEPSLVAPLSELLRGVSLDPALLARVTALDEASATKDKNGPAAATSQPSEFWQQLLDDDSIAEGEERVARVGSPLVRIGAAPKQPFKMVHLSSPIHPTVADM